MCRLLVLVLVSHLAAWFPVAVAPASVWPSGTPAAGEPTRAEASCDSAIRRDAAKQRLELSVSCRLTEGIRIPDGWTFDGMGKAILLADPPGGRFKGAALGVFQGVATIRDVAIDGAELAPGCPEGEPLAGIAFVQASGKVERVTIDRLHRGAEARCGIGIEAADRAPSPVTISDSVIRDVGDAAVDAQACARVVMADDFIFSKQAVVGVRARTGAHVTVGPESIVAVSWYAVASNGAGTFVHVDRSNIGGAMYALEVTDGASARVTGGAIMMSMFGVQASGASSVEIGGETMLTGLTVGVFADGPAGKIEIEDVDFEGIDTAGVVVGGPSLIAIRGSRFARVGADEWDRGIMISLASGQQVTIDGNRFSDTAVPISMGGTGGKASIDGNSINGVRDGAIVIYGGVTAIVSGNTIEGLATSSRSSRAIRVEDDANVELRGNRISGISGPASCAIEIETTGTVEMSDNDVAPDEARMAFCGSGSP